MLNGRRYRKSVSCAAGQSCATASAFPGINNFDFSVVKNTYFVTKERVNLQFRAEVFNLWNRVWFGSPGNSLGTPQFGVISTQANEPRLIQLALRFMF